MHTYCEGRKSSTHIHDIETSNYKERMRQSFPRQVDKKSRVTKERGV